MPNPYVKQIGIKNAVYEALIEYKNRRAHALKKAKYSFSDAIHDLLQDSVALSEWMIGKQLVDNEH